MDEHFEHGQDDAAARRRPQGRGGLEDAIRGALRRSGRAGPAHWGGQDPPRRFEPIDVAGTGRPGRLPPTA